MNWKQLLSDNFLQILIFAVIFIVGFLDPVAYTDTVLDRIFFFTKQVIWELIIIGIAVSFIQNKIIFPKFTKNKLLPSFKNGVKIFDYLKASFVTNKDIWSVIIASLIIVFFMEFQTLKSLGGGLKYKYTQSLALKYRAELIHKAREFEEAGRIEYALNQYEKIKNAHPNLAEVRHVNNKIVEIKNRVVLADDLFLHYNSGKDKITRARILHLIYASMLNPENSLYKEELLNTKNHLIKLKNKNKIKSNFYFHNEPKFNYSMSHEKAMNSINQNINQDILNKEISKLLNIKEIKNVK